MKNAMIFFLIALISMPQAWSYDRLSFQTPLQDQKPVVQESEMLDKPALQKKVNDLKTKTSKEITTLQNSLAAFENDFSKKRAQILDETGPAAKNLRAMFSELRDLFNKKGDFNDPPTQTKVSVFLQKMDQAYAKSLSDKNLGKIETLVNNYLNVLKTSSKKFLQDTLAYKKDILKKANKLLQDINKPGSKIKALLSSWKALEAKISNPPLFKSPNDVPTSLKDNLVIGKGILERFKASLSISTSNNIIFTIQLGTFFNEPKNVDVLIDPSLNQGDLRTLDGVVGGSYAFVPIQDDSVTRFVLTLTWKTGETHYYFVNPNRTQYFHFNYLPNSLFISPNHFDASEPFWKNAAKFFEDPLAFLDSATAEENSALVSACSKPKWFCMNYYFLGVLIPDYLFRLFEALKANPDYHIKPGKSIFSETMSHPMTVGGYHYFSHIPANTKQKLAEGLNQVWDQLSSHSGPWNFSFSNPKLDLLRGLDAGNSTTMNLLGKLWIKYIDEITDEITSLNLSPNLFANVSVAGLLSHTLGQSNALKSLLQDSNLRKDLIQRLLVLLNVAAFNPNSSFSDSIAYLNILYEVLVKGDGIIVRAEDYRDSITDLVAKIWSLEKNRPISFNILYVLTAMFDRFSNFLSPSLIQELTHFIDETLSTYTGDLRTTYFLLSALNWPLDAERKQKIENALVSNDFSSAEWNIAKLDYSLPFHVAGIGNPVGYKPVGLSAENLSNLTAKLVPFFLDKFGQRHADDGFSGGYDTALSGFIGFLKGSPSFPALAPLLFPLLQEFNPQQVGETDLQYADRFEKIKNLLTEGGIFLFDLTGGTYKRNDPPNYLIDAFSNYAKTHPDWIDIGVLKTTLEKFSGTAGAGVVQMNWNKDFTTADRISYNLSHEGGHARDLKNIDFDLDFVNASFFFGKTSDIESTFNNNYASTNEEEYFAEHAMNWYGRGHKVLADSLQEYKKGNTAKLNMFVFLWNKTIPKNRPSQDVLPLYRVDENNTAILYTEYVKAEWIQGDMRDGIFQFELDGKTCKVTYKNYLIISFS